MPQPFSSAVITNSGIKMLAQVHASSAKIEMTKMVIGNGVYSKAEKEIYSLQNRTSLKSKKNEYAFSNMYVVSNTSAKLTALVTNQNPATKEILVEEGYYINEIGIYARVNGGQEELYSIAVTDGEQGDYMPPYNGYSPVQIIQDYYVTADSSETLVIQTTGAALLVEDANIITDDITHEKWRLGIENGNMYYEEVLE